jgi:serine/threonine protein kinase
VLYELLTGAQPFDGGGNPHALMHQHLNQPPPAPRSRRPDVPEPLDRLVLDLLAKNPAERPPSADAVAAFLRSPATAAQATVAQTRYTAKNLGGGVPDLADTSNDTQGVLQDRRTMLSTLVSGDFPKCEDHPPNNGELPKGASYQACALFLAPTGDTVTGVEWVQSETDTYSDPHGVFWK